MRGWRLRWLLALAGLCACCAHSSPPVTTFGHCTTEALNKAGQALLGDVMTAIATSDYVGELGTLVAKFGGEEVACAVDLAIAELGGALTRSPDEAMLSKMLEHAQAWRGAHP